MKSSLLKFITCGSVDDGKSTLIGHMLYDAKLLFADQERSLELDSRLGSNEGELDYSLLLDGLLAEREQGITIDVAYRYFTTSKRSFIVADTPGHEEYTRNMAVGASFADLAIILVDASKGVLIQTKRHARICHLMGIKHIVLAVNKMDLIDYDKEHFDNIEKEFKHVCRDFDLKELHVIPVSATKGDNLIASSANTAWYQGASLLSILEETDVSSASYQEKFILPIQRVSRPNLNFRGFQGEIEAGTLDVGAEVTALPNGENAFVSQILAGDKEVSHAIAGQAVTVCLDKEIDVSRGCVLTTSTELKVTDMFQASLLWMDNKELVAGRTYLLKLGTKVINASIMGIKYQTDINTGEHTSSTRLKKNEMATVEIATSEKMIFDEFKHNKTMGSFIMIDRLTHMTSACGVIDFALRRSENVVWHENDLGRDERARQKDQKPLTLWFTGLSGSGKSTLANALERRLFSLGKHTTLLDGDNIRHGLNKNLGFNEVDRIENIRRVSEVARLMNEAGLIVLTAFISPYSKDRDSAKEVIGDSYLEIYVSTPLEECKKRDVKGLYAKAQKGEIPNFTGVSAPYDIPQNPFFEIDTSQISVEEAVDVIFEKLKTYW